MTLFKRGKWGDKDNWVKNKGFEFEASFLALDILPEQKDLKS